MNWNKTQIKEKLEGCWMKNKLYNYPIDILKVAESKSIDVFQADFKDEISGYIVQKNGGAEIVVNKWHSYLRKRFTLAHEIGHFILHLEPNSEHNEEVDTDDMISETVLYRDQTTNSQEQEANLFAAELLMDEELLKDAIKKNRDHLGFGKISFLASLFEVSEQAYEI